MTKDVLIPNKMLASVEEALDETYTVHKLYEADNPDAMLAENSNRIGVIASSAGASRDLIEKLPNLKLVSHFGVGYDPVDVEACKEHNIRVTNTPDVLNDAVAECTLGLMLALCRKIPQADRFVREGRWEDGGYPLTAELTGTTAGILGLGRIGKEVARRLQAMKMQVVYHGRSEQVHEPYPYYSNLQEMAKACDWLVIIIPGSVSTQKIVDAKVIAALGPEGALVNVARGAVVDQDAMIAALQNGTLGGAALDVFADEPHVPESLRELDNVVLSPHQGSATHKTRWGMGDLVVRNIHAHMKGEPLISPVA